MAPKGETRDRQVAFANKNEGFFAMNLMLAAKDMGIDTHPMDGFDMEAVRAEFKIPAHFWVLLLLAVGHFHQDMALLPRKWRKSYDDIVVRFDG